MNENVRKRHEKYPFTPPETKLFIKHKYWGIHEAAFELTGWPTEDFYEFSVFKIKEEIKKDRPFFYIPKSGEINSKKYGKKFEKMFQSIKDAIDNFHLRGTHQPICCGSNYVVSPWDVIIWALRNGHEIREGLQAALEIYQDTQKPKKALRKEVKNLTQAQCYLANQTYRYVDPICKKIKGENKDTTAIRKQINKKLFDAQGESGRPTKKKKNKREYIHKALAAVRTIDRNGRAKYQFVLLEDAITTIVFEKIKLISVEILQTMNSDTFLDELGSDVTANLYLSGATDVIFHFVCQIAEEHFSSIQDLYTTPTLAQKLKLFSLEKKFQEK